jgi:hypothetical protein
MVFVKLQYHGTQNLTHLKRQSLKRNEVDYNLYYMKEGIKIVILLLYVDDLLMIGSECWVL